MGTTTIERIRVRDALRARLDEHPVLIPGLASLTLFGLLLAIHFWMVWIGRFPGDGYVLAHFGAPFNERRLEQRWTSFFSHVGTLEVAIPLVAIATLVLWRYEGIVAVEGLVIVCFASVANLVLKPIFGPSPDWGPSHPANASFPSGHVTFITAVIGYLGIWAWRHRRTRVLSLVAALMVVCVGPARVVAGVHLFSDVVGGYLLAAAFLVAAFGWVNLRISGIVGLGGLQPRAGARSS